MASDSTSVHKIAQYPQQWSRYSFRGRGAFWDGRSSHKGSLGGARPQGQDYRHNTETTCEFCGSRPHKHRSECKASGQECFYCGRLGHFSKMYKQNPKKPGQWQDWGQAHRHRRSLQTMPRVSTQPLTTSQMIKWKHQSNASRLQQKSTTCTTKTQST